MYSEIFIRMALAHVIGDFVFQTDKWCSKKMECGLMSCHLYVHSLIISLLTWGALWSWSAWWIAIVIGTSHLIVDALKKSNGLWSFLLDQSVHIIFIGIFGYIAADRGIYGNLCFDSTILLYPLILLLNTKPANIMIKLLLREYSIADIGNKDHGEHDSGILSGKLIGNLERWLIIIFILCKQFDAIGFLIAAKSIIRYKEGAIGKTEYVLAGTLLSVFLAVISGLLLSIISPQP